MLKVFGGFVLSLGILVGGYRLVFSSANRLRILSLLQAYVFAILTCIYLNDIKFTIKQKGGKMELEARK